MWPFWLKPKQAAHDEAKTSHDDRLLLLVYRLEDQALHAAGQLLQRTSPSSVSYIYSHLIILSADAPPVRSLPPSYFFNTLMMFARGIYAYIKWAEDENSAMLGTVDMTGAQVGTALFRALYSSKHRSPPFFICTMTSNSPRLLQVDGKAMHAGGSDIEADQKLRVFKLVPTKGIRLIPLQ